MKTLQQKDHHKSESCVYFLWFSSRYNLTAPIDVFKKWISSFSWLHYWRVVVCALFSFRVCVCVLAYWRVPCFGTCQTIHPPPDGTKTKEKIIIWLKTKKNARERLWVDSSIPCMDDALVHIGSSGQTLSHHWYSLAKATSERTWKFLINE